MSASCFMNVTLEQHHVRNITDFDTNLNNSDRRYASLHFFRFVVQPAPELRLLRSEFLEVSVRANTHQLSFIVVVCRKQYQNRFHCRTDNSIHSEFRFAASGQSMGTPFPLANPFISLLIAAEMNFSVACCAHKHGIQTFSNAATATFKICNFWQRCMC